MTMFVGFINKQHAINLTDLLNDILVNGKAYPYDDADFILWCNKYNQKQDLLTYVVAYTNWLGLSLANYWRNIER